MYKTHHSVSFKIVTLYPVNMKRNVVTSLFG